MPPPAASVDGADAEYAAQLERLLPASEGPDVLRGAYRERLMRLAAILSRARAAERYAFSSTVARTRRGEYTAASRAADDDARPVRVPIHTPVRVDLTEAHVDTLARTRRHLRAEAYRQRRYARHTKAWV